MRSHLFSRVLSSLVLGFAAYCALSVIAGPAGLIAYRELSSRKDAMQANLDALGATNAALQAELEALRNDPDRAAREARELGYLGPGEVALVVQGDGGARNRAPLDAGSIMKARAPVPIADAIIKELSLLVGLVSLIAGLASDLLAQSPGRQGGAQGRRDLSGRRKPSRAGSLGGLGV